MKVNKISSWVYGIFMLLPFLICLCYALVWAFSRNDLANSNYFTDVDGIGYLMEYVFSDTFLAGLSVNSKFYSTMNDFVLLFTNNNSVPTFIVYYITYGITISLVYLGYDVLLAFINIARKLVYAFVDKEF